MNNRQVQIGILAMVATASLWSIAGLFIKVIDWNPYAIAGLRSFIASIVLLIYLRKPVFHLSFPQVAAAVANAATMLLFVIANKTTTAANAILLQYVAPILTAFIGAALLKERTRIEHWIAFAVVAAGMLIMFMDELGTGQMTGNMLALTSALTFSLYFVFMRMQKDGSPFESILLSHWITAGVCLFISFFLPMPHFTLKSTGTILVLGVIQIGFSSILFAVAIKRITAVSAILIAVIEPVFNPVWVFLVLHESPGLHSIIGGAVIVAAVTGVSIISTRRQSRRLKV
ncbi:MAG: EamA family transporter [Spirochaetae bacterium HGW-Spirochaetae-5]|nr:MAG: EamA family transporter [Spirochaetae bacterium HGW-Spirochaetae-5]